MTAELVNLYLKQIEARLQMTPPNVKKILLECLHQYATSLLTQPSVQNEEFLFVNELVMKADLDEYQYALLAKNMLLPLNAEHVALKQAKTTAQSYIDVFNDVPNVCLEVPELVGDTDVALQNQMYLNNFSLRAKEDFHYLSNQKKSILKILINAGLEQLTDRQHALRVENKLKLAEKIALAEVIRKACYFSHAPSLIFSRVVADGTYPLRDTTKNFQIVNCWSQQTYDAYQQDDAAGFKRVAFYTSVACLVMYAVTDGSLRTTMSAAAVICALIVMFSDAIINRDIGNDIQKRLDATEDKYFHVVKEYECPQARAIHYAKHLAKTGYSRWLGLFNKKAEEPRIVVNEIIYENSSESSGDRSPSPTHLKADIKYDSENDGNNKNTFVLANFRR